MCCSSVVPRSPPARDSFAHSQAVESVLCGVSQPAAQDDVIIHGGGHPGTVRKSRARGNSGTPSSLPEIYPWVLFPAGPEAPEVVIGARGFQLKLEKVPGHWELSHVSTGEVILAWCPRGAADWASAAKKMESCLHKLILQGPSWATPCMRT